MNLLDVKLSHFNGVKDALGLRAVWDIHEVESLYGTTNLDGTTIVFNSYKKGPVKSPVLGNTFLDLYRAANDCIVLGGEYSHIYIEGFTFSEDRKVLTLVTGS